MYLLFVVKCFFNIWTGVFSALIVLQTLPGDQLQACILPLLPVFLGGGSVGRD
jgi:hypothetical protein